MQHAAPTSTTASWMRPALLALSASSILLGLWMVVAPGSFFDAIADFGPRNDHFLRDVASYYLAAGIALAIAAGRPSWRAPVLALVTLQYGFHALNHLLDIGDADPSWVGPFDAVLLIATFGLLAVVLRAALREEERT
jgi:hypothetical protein